MKRVLTAVLFTTLGYLIGTMEAASARRSETLYSKLEVLAEVLGEIESNYVDMLSPTQLIYGAAKGAAAQLDEHSQFFTPEEYVALRSTTDGEYAGIGIEMRQQGAQAKITKVYEDSPAAQAGLEPGDLLLAVNGEAVSTESLGQTTRRLRGRVGTKVVV
ncbi:MAG: PDZ domain-containing protein, partial [Myxococcota bacterium]